jgi:hypothetical protein
LVANSSFGALRRAGRTNAFANETGQSTVIVRAKGADGLGSCHRPAAVHDQYRRTALDAVDERAEIVLSFSDTGLLHNGYNSLIEMSLQAGDMDCQCVSVVSQGFWERPSVSAGN